MKKQTFNKRKIINDPIYGLITIPDELIYDIIEHPYFQRLRRIKQLGLTYYVYPGATHTRFQHVIGATNLMKSAIETLRSKGHTITNEEERGLLVAILCHDLGHGPFSHTLEQSFVENITHEEISLRFMESINNELNGALSVGIDIFAGKSKHKFLHQLVSSQLDMDRLDYLRRDSFFTGVSEGVIGLDRIIKMLNVSNNELVVDAKGIYSIEKFLIARRLMYWQVYLHKTVVVTEQMLTKIIKRAKELTKTGKQLFATPALDFFLKNDIKSKEAFCDGKINNNALLNFSKLDDYDIMAAIKVWTEDKDKVLSLLCKSLIERNLLKIEIFPESQSIDSEKVTKLRKETMTQYGISEQDTEYFVFSDTIYNKAYSKNKDEIINILYNNGKLIDIAIASDISNVSVLSKTVIKSFLCYPKF